ncbi:MAG TPA: helix-turn-helix transcriptional regulator [Pseudonocardiaceae bacterium]|nr:helix-turn-helix transcriptional regulator [Pseudonocardiaceae bacterium]
MVSRRRRLASTRKAAGFSQERLAEKIGVERSTIMRWERGETTPQPWARPKLARALGILDQELSELLSESAEPEPASSVPEVLAGKAESLYHRDSLKYSVVFPVLGPDELRHLGAAFEDARCYFDIDVVGYFKKQLSGCAANDNTHGPAKALPSALGIVSAIENHAREVKADVRRELLTVGAQAAEFVGWLYRDARQPRLSGHWQDRAMEWAQEAGDLPMQATFCSRRARPPGMSAMACAC